MIRSTALAISSGLFSLATGAEVQADLIQGQIQHEFTFDDLLGAGPSVISFLSTAAYDIETGEAYFDAQGIETDFSIIPLANFSAAALIGGSGELALQVELDFYDLNTDAALQISVVETQAAYFDGEGFGWSAPELTASYYYEQGSGFQGGETGTLTGSWSALVVPSPGAMALLGLAGLAGRRRRD